MTSLDDIRLRLDVRPADTSHDALIEAILQESIDHFCARFGLDIDADENIVERRAINPSADSYWMTLPIGALVSVKQVVDGVTTDITTDCGADTGRVYVGAYDNYIPSTELTSINYVEFTYTSTAAAMATLNKIIAMMTIHELLQTPPFGNAAGKSSIDNDGVKIVFAAEADFQAALEQKIRSIVAPVVA